MATGKQVFIRTVVTVALPFILIWAFSAELWQGIKSAFYYAWLEVQIGCDDYRRQMRREDY
jgi:hypothetical protein